MEILKREKRAALPDHGIRQGCSPHNNGLLRLRESIPNSPCLFELGCQVQGAAVCTGTAVGGTWIFFAVAAASELVRQRSSLRDPVGFVNVPNGIHTGHQHFAHNRPFVQSGGALKGYTNTVEDGGILFLAAAD